MQNDSSGITLSPKASFILGLAGGVLVLCTIGFFILLGLVLGGKANIKDGSPAAAKPNAPAAAVPNVPSPADEDVVGEIPPITNVDHVEGPANADVTLYVYTDIECPFCSRFHPSLTQAMDEYEGRIRTVIRHFPLSFHAQARPAANAAECAGEQKMFFEYFDELFANQESLGATLYDDIADELGLNMKKFNDCVDAKKFDGKISADMAGGIAAGVKGTPGTIIVGADGEPQLVPGAVPFETLKAMIEAAF